MAVYDRWHKSRPKPGEKQCTEHRLVPTKEHGTGLRWQVRWYEGDRQSKLNLRTKVEADKKDREIQEELARLKLSTVVNPWSITIRDVAEQWLDAKIVKDDTLYNLEICVRGHICVEPFGSTLVKDIERDPNLIQIWIKGLVAKRLKVGYIRTLCNYMSSIMGRCSHLGLIQQNPMQSPLVTVPRAEKMEVIPYSTADLIAITRNLKSKYEPVPKAGSGLGLRIGEIMGLSPDDFQDGYVHVQRQVKVLGRSYTTVFDLPKGGKTRIVPAPESVARYFAEMPSTPVTLPWKTKDGDSAKHRLFMSNRGRILSVSAVRAAWSKALNAASVPSSANQAFHKLRHTYASRLLKAGVDIRTLSRYLGHENPAFTLRVYCHFIPGSEDAARRAIDALDMP